MNSSTLKLIIGALLIFSVIQSITLWGILKFALGGWLIIEYLREEKGQEEATDFFV